MKNRPYPHLPDAPLIAFAISPNGGIPNKYIQTSKYKRWKTVTDRACPNFLKLIRKVSLVPPSFPVITY